MLCWVLCSCSFRLIVMERREARIKRNETKNPRTAPHIGCWTERKRSEMKRKACVTSFPLPFLFYSLRSFFLPTAYDWWGLVCVVCCVPFGCNGMEWSTNRTEHTTRHNPNPELVCQVQKSQFKIKKRKERAFILHLPLFVSLV